MSFKLIMIDCFLVYFIWPKKTLRVGIIKAIFNLPIDKGYLGPFVIAAASAALVYKKSLIRNSDINNRHAFTRQTRVSLALSSWTRTVPIHQAL